LNGHVASDSGGVVKVPFGSEYGVRLKNKRPGPVAVDLYIDGQLANQAGHICLTGNSSLDVDQWILSGGTARKFQFERLTHKGVAEPNEAENGLVEARFYVPKEEVKIVPTTIYIDRYPYYPIWPYIIEEHHHHHHYPRPWWPLWDRNEIWYDMKIGSSLDHNVYNQSDSKPTGDITFNSAIGSSTNAEPQITYGTSPINGSSSFASNGATVQGREVEKQDLRKVTFDLQLEAVTLQLRLIGYKGTVTNTTRCPNCGNHRKDSDIFCSRCGLKLRSK
jgi:hypothetical protein